MLCKKKLEKNLGDLYSELLVKKDKTAKDSLLKYGLIVLTVLAVFAGLIITPLALDHCRSAWNCMLFL